MLDSGGSGGGVNSFNTRMGAVTLTLADVSTVADSRYVLKSGDTMTGDLNLLAGVHLDTDGSAFFSTGSVTITGLGNLGLLDTSSASVGVILKSGVPFIHNYKDAASTGRNTFVGANAGNFTMGAAAKMNTAVGAGALFANTTGLNNTAIGADGLVSNTTGAENSAIGVNALFFNTTGGSNTAIGVSALQSNTTGGFNSAVGLNALFSNTTGASNVAFGVNASSANTTGADNSAIGVNALRLNTTGSRNSVVGSTALFDLDITAGGGLGANTAVGYNTGRGIVTGVNNTILGANVTGLGATLSNNIIISDGAGNQRITANATGDVTVAQSLTVGKNLIVPTGANKRAGNIALIAGTITVANTTVTADTLVMLTRKTAGGTIGTAITYTLFVGTSFTINSDNPLDTSTFSYFLIENP